MSIAHGDHDPVQAAVREILSYGNDGSFIINRVDHYLETFCGNHNQSHKLDAETIKDIKDRLKEGLFNSHLPPPVGDKEGDSLDRVALFYAQISQAALLQAREEGMIDCLLACLLASFFCWHIAGQSTYYSSTSSSASFLSLFRFPICLMLIYNTEVILSGLLEEYTAVRMQMLDRKAALLARVEAMTDLEVERQASARRDLQVRRAIYSARVASSEQ